MQNRCSKKLENHCQNGSQNELKSIKISLLRRPLAIDSVIFGLLERCQNIMFFLVPLWRLKKSKSWPKMRPTGPQPRERDPTLASLVPQGGPARDLVQDTRYKSQDTRLVGLGYKGKLASWLRVQGKFKG